MLHRGDPQSTSAESIAFGPARQHGPRSRRPARWGRPPGTPPAGEGFEGRESRRGRRRRWRRRPRRSRPGPWELGKSRRVRALRGRRARPIREGLRRVARCIPPLLGRLGTRGEGHGPLQGRRLRRGGGGLREMWPGDGVEVGLHAGQPTLGPWRSRAARGPDFSWPAQGKCPGIQPRGRQRDCLRSDRPAVEQSRPVPEDCPDVGTWRLESRRRMRRWRMRRMMAGVAWPRPWHRPRIPQCRYGQDQGLGGGCLKGLVLVEVLGWTAVKSWCVVTSEADCRGLGLPEWWK
jgi:hypothetical protein